MAGGPEVEGQQDRSVSGHQEFRCCTTAVPATVWSVLTDPAARSCSTIRLSVDEPGLTVEDTEAEDIWLPVLAALPAVLGSDQIGPAHPDGE